MANRKKVRTMNESRIEERVGELFSGEAFCCAETALLVMIEASGEEHLEYAKFASGLCAGVSRTRGKCGAINGTIMGLGYYAGKKQEGEKTEELFAMVQHCEERFAERFGTSNCWELTECDFKTEAGREKFKSDGVITKCCEYTTFSVTQGVNLLKAEGLL